MVSWPGLVSLWITVSVSKEIKSATKGQQIEDHSNTTDSCLTRPRPLASQDHPGHLTRPGCQPQSHAQPLTIQNKQKTHMSFIYLEVINKMDFLSHNDITCKFQSKVWRIQDNESHEGKTKAVGLLHWQVKKILKLQKQNVTASFQDLRELSLRNDNKLDLTQA